MAGKKDTGGKRPAPKTIIREQVDKSGRGGAINIGPKRGGTESTGAKIEGGKKAK